MAKKAQGRHKEYYKQQRDVTILHKTQQAIKRKKDLDFWIAKGVNKKGEKVLNLDERKERAVQRRSLRSENKRNEQIRKQEADRLWRESKKKKNKPPKSFIEEE